MCTTTDHPASLSDLSLLELGVCGLEGWDLSVENELGAGFLFLFLPARSASASPYNRCKGSIYLVFDFCEHDLAGLLSNVLVKFTLSEIKRVMQMLLNGLYYIHRNKVRAGFGRTAGASLLLSAV